jgi:hypothetical protein
MTINNLTGFIRGIKYKAYLNEGLTKISLADFDVNTANSSGVIDADGVEIGYSKWVSPKRTRSYPFARIYNTYNCAKIITIIPVLKDEGKDGDLDKIQYSTISWMNLLNVYIVLGYYDKADKNTTEKQINKEKLTNQKFKNDFVKEQIQEIVEYRQSALHWNKNLFEDRFLDIFTLAMDSYSNISKLTGVQRHSYAGIKKYLSKVEADFEEFKNLSLKGSQDASKRESQTSHQLEYLVDGIKSTFCIENYLGGVYYLTPDELIKTENGYLIQESKNSSRKALPDLTDIQDGLFKLVLYSNIDSLSLNDRQVDFQVKLKLTGKGVIGKLESIGYTTRIDKFLNDNSSVFNEKENQIIRKLMLESQKNTNLIIEIQGN